MLTFALTFYMYFWFSGSAKILSQLLQVSSPFKSSANLINDFIHFTSISAE